MKIRVFKFIAIFLAVNFLAQVLFPTAVFALTGGPSQPEVQSFEPIGTSEMVDVFSGDFVYNIPLLNVGNYPVNISYHSGVSMDEEASWVGLGWNINPGVINRNMRNLPDDFDGNKGDYITKRFNVRPNKTYGVTGTFNPEIVQLDFLSIGLGLGINYNNYRGFGLEQIYNLSLTAGDASKGENTATLGINASTSSHNGMTIGADVSFSGKCRDTEKRDSRLGLSIGTSFNSRAGLGALTWGAKASGEKTQKSLNAMGEVLKSKSSIRNVVGFNGGGTISFTSPSYMTPTSLPMKYTAAAFTVRWGGTLFANDFIASVSGYYSEQKLTTNEKNYKAFGYMNSEKNEDYSSLLDFNREKDVTFTKNTPALPVTSYTYDVFSVSGQGIGGMYRPFRSDVGVVFDSKLNNNSDSYSLGLEIASGNLVKGGINPRAVFSNTKTGAWKDGNSLAGKVSFKKRDNQEEDLYYEPFYFKQAGEKSVDSEFDDKNSFYKSIGENNAVRADLDRDGGFNVSPTGQLKTADGVNLPVNEHVHRRKRQKRNESISYLNFKEAKDFAINKNLFEKADDNNKGNVAYPGKDHHIAEITTLNAQGVRYVYGLPAYNTAHKEVTFSSGEGGKQGKLLTDGDGLITYGNGDNSTGNTRGLDNYYQSNETPAYAHSYLLTSVLSPDYVDNDGVDGPSQKDMGSFTLFKYEKTSDYEWRVPLGEKKANSNEGFYSLNQDDQGNYIYGKKDLWYLESIEDKNFIAKFITGEREDGLGVQGEDGAISTAKRLKYLQRIELYNKNDMQNPIKTVHFVYDYSRCPNIINNSGEVVDDKGLKAGDPGFDPAKNINKEKGKLTLTKIYFTYKKSNKAKFSPYVFTYHEKNPTYHMKKYDRWGSFKNFTGSFYDNTNFPYAEQNKTEADENASAWSLSKIDLPSGGQIEVRYESDDYAYVQDKRAMQMFKVLGVSHNTTDNFDHLYSNTNNNFDYIVLDLGQDAENMNSEKFIKKYLTDETGKVNLDLYFRFRVYLGVRKDDWSDLNYSDRSKLSDFVPGYCKIVPSELVINGGKAYIKVEMPPMGDRDGGDKINPILKAALQFSRNYTPRLAYGMTDVSDGAVDQVLLSIINSSPTKSLLEMIKGVNRSMMEKGHCKYFIANESYIRLYNPNGFKLGGGARVKSVSIKDNASSVVNSNLTDSEYGQIYTYTTEDANGNEISSGVANYEPLLGGDEIPHHQPIAYGNKQEKLLYPDDKSYLEDPMGESFFPAASVGYSKIKVKSLNGEKSKTGYVIHEFYTAKDFPTIVDRTDMQLLPKKSNLAGRLLQLKVRDYMNASQGYVVEVNDMHGKPKAQWVYGHNQNTYISGIEYKYKSTGNRLDSKATIILPDGKIKEANIGVDVDMVTDMREQFSQTTSVGLNGNLAAFLAAIFPGALPLILPSYSHEETRFRSIVATKVVNRSGLLEETIVHDLGSKVVNKNIAWDGETGELLVSQVQNNFNDPVYNFTFPAHWAYNRMGPAYQNIGLEYTLNLDGGEGNVKYDDKVKADPFAIGDELIVTYNEGLEDNDEDFVKKLKKDMQYRFYVVARDEDNLIIMGGAPAEAEDANKCVVLMSGETRVKIIRSGRRNMSNIPVGTITCLQNPLTEKDGKTLKVVVDFDKFSHQVLAASAGQFYDEWYFCSCDIKSGKFFNPVFSGTKANWRPRYSYTYLTDRTKTSVEANLRKDGYFKAFNSFWTIPSTTIEWDAHEDSWTRVNEVTGYDLYAGAEVENMDPLKRYTNARNGYNHQVPMSVSSNAKYSDILFDSFEDKDKVSCIEKVSKFAGGSIVDSKSHTGRSSIKIQKNSSGASYQYTIGRCEKEE